MERYERDRENEQDSSWWVNDAQSGCIPKEKTSSHGELMTLLLRALHILLSLAIGGC